MPLRLRLLALIPLALMLLTAPLPLPSPEESANVASAADVIPTANVAAPAASPEATNPDVAPPANVDTPPVAANSDAIAPSGGAAVAPPGLAPLGEPGYVPILMYHYVRYVDAGADPLGFNLSVTPDNLAAQLDLVAQRGYTTVRMDALARCIAGQQQCPARAIALTFDDGYADAFSQALPILQARGMVATFYIVSGFVGQPGYMGWDEIRALHAAGMEIGSHTVTHPDLTTLGLDQIRGELAESRAAIEAAIGAPVTSFCYPAGRFDDDVAALAQETGYLNATTTMPDLPAGDLMRLPRLRVEGSYGAAEVGWLIP